MAAWEKRKKERAINTNTNPIQNTSTVKVAMGKYACSLQSKCEHAIVRDEGERERERETEQ